MGRGHLDCIECGQPIDGSGPGVCQIRRDDELTWGWVAFIEDWRGGYVDLLHPVCFAKVHGVAKLVEVVHQRDLIERGEVPRLMMEVEELRRRLG